MASDAIARQYDVDADAMKLLRPLGQMGDYQLGTITFFAKKGHSIDLDKMCESITATRLSGGTHMRVDSLEISAKGEVFERDKDLVLKISGTDHEFLLKEDPAATDYLKRLRDAVSKRNQEFTVTGRVPGWYGRFPEILAAWTEAPASKKRQLEVMGFEVDKK
jgi:hypothetical protein